MEPLTIALSKGRILTETLELFKKIQWNFDEINEDSRKLFFVYDQYKIKLILAKPSDVPTYVEYGVADLGIAGKDVLLEDKNNVFELLDLKMSCCKMSIAVPNDRNSQVPIYRIATKYPNIAEEYFLKKGQSVEIIKLNGSVELGPILGLSDAIVDIVSTGNTLKKNRLKVLEDMYPISARLIANQVSFRIKSQRILGIMDELKRVI